MATATNSRGLSVQGMCVDRRRGSKTFTLAISLAKNILNFGSKRDRKNCDSRKDAKTPSLENQKYILIFAPLRPFDFAQDMLGAINFLEVVVLNISRLRMDVGVRCQYVKSRYHGTGSFRIALSCSLTRQLFHPFDNLGRLRQHLLG